MSDSKNAFFFKKSSSKKIIIICKLAILTIIFYTLIHHSQLQLNLLWTAFDNFPASLSIIGICYLMVIMHTWRWYRLNSTQEISIPFLKTIAPTYFGIAFNTVLPGSVGGDFIRLYYVFRMFPDRKSHAILSVFVDRICGLMGIFVIACLTIPYYTSAFLKHDALSYLLIGCYGVFFSSIIVFIILTRLLTKDSRFVAWITNKNKQSKIAKVFSSLFEAIYLYRNAKWVIFESIVVSMVTQFLLLVVVLLISKMLNIPMVPIIDYMIALVIAQIANLLPLTPGGIGVGEAAFANILLLLNPSVAPYATIFFVLRLLSTIAYVPGVIFCIFGFQGKNREIIDQS